MKTFEYWKRAALLREVAVQEGATATAKDVLKLYDEALDDINTEIQKIKYNFQKRYGLDEKTAAMFLTEAQREENLASLIYALENAPDEKARRSILKYIQRDGLSVRAYASRIERYDAVKQSIYARVKRLAVDETALISGMLKKAYSMSYYSVMDDTAKGLDVGINFGILNDNAIAEAVSAKWNGKRFSERIWDNTDKLAKEAQKLVTKSIMSGESWNKTADKLANRFQVEKYHATTLVHTEAAHAHAMADMKAYEDLGVEEYKWLSTLDYATCETCQPLDGKVFKLSEAKEGVTIPPLHPRCRCTIIMNIDYSSRIARNPLTGRNYKVDGDMTYNEWIKSLTPEQKQALKTTRLKESRKVADKEQWLRYKKTLGTKVIPRSFSDFQEIKYNDTNRWSEVKELYRHNNIDKSFKSDIIKLGSGSNIMKPDEIIHRSLGASGRNYPVKLPSGNHAKFAEGTKITNIKVFAGKDTNEPIRDAIYLEADFGIKAEKWQKVRGEGIIMNNGKPCRAEVHWYEAEGQKEKMKVKRWIDDET